MVVIPGATFGTSVAAAFFSSPFFALHATNCDIALKTDSIPIPPNQTVIEVPSIAPTFVGLAYGTQNYSCSEAGNFTEVAVLAEVIDVSCFVGSSIFPSLPERLYDIWTNQSQPDIEAQVAFFNARFTPEILAQHYLVPDPSAPGNGWLPKWDFTSSGKFKGVENAYMIGRINASVPDATNSTLNGPWLLDVSIEGSIADNLYRSNPHGGQAPAGSCQFGKTPNVLVKYVAVYWFFGGSLGNIGGN